MTKLLTAKPFIIAEVGSNWSNFEQAKDSISMAKTCGADAVKFQAYDSYALFGFKPEGKLLGELPLEWLPKLKEKADACNIEFMCTAFSPKIAEIVNSYVEVHKIASSNLTDPFLLEAVGKTKKPVILSTGAGSYGDIVGAVKILEQNGASNIVLMYCNAAYPSRYHDLFIMNDLRNSLHKEVGFSDHTTDVIFAPLCAVKMFNAVCIEKHFTAFENLDSQDRQHSLTRDEFKHMVDYIRGDRLSAIGPSVEEQPMILRHNVRCIATKDMKAGEMLNINVNFGVHRSLKDDSQGLIGFAWQHINGKTLRQDVQAGDGLSMLHVS